MSKYGRNDLPALIGTNMDASRTKLESSIANIIHNT